MDILGIEGTNLGPAILLESFSGVGRKEVVGLEIVAQCMGTYLPQKNLWVQFLPSEIS